jgi:hypothetical protein
MDIVPGDGSDLVWNDFAFDGQNLIYLLDGTQVVVDRYSADGKWLGSGAYRGQGPGEFQQYPAIHGVERGFWLTKYDHVARFDNTGKLEVEKRLSKFDRKQTALDKTRLLFVRDRHHQDRSWQSQLLLTDIQTDLTKGMVLFDGANLGHRRLVTSSVQATVFFDDGVLPDIFFTHASWRKIIAAGLMETSELSLFDYQGHLLKTIKLPLKPLPLQETDRRILADSMMQTDPEVVKGLKKLLPETFHPIRALHLLGPSWLLVEKFFAADDVRYLCFDETGSAMGELKFPGDRKILKLKCQGAMVAMLVEEDELNRFVVYSIKNLSGTVLDR